MPAHMQLHCIYHVLNVYLLCVYHYVAVIVYCLSVVRTHFKMRCSSSVHYYHYYYDNNRNVYNLGLRSLFHDKKYPLSLFFSINSKSSLMVQIQVNALTSTTVHYYYIYNSNKFLHFGPLELFLDQNCHFNLLISIDSKYCSVFQVQVNALTSRRTPLVTGALEVRRLGWWGWGRATVGVVPSLLLVWELRDCSDAARAISFLAVLAGRICFLNSWKIG